MKTIGVDLHRSSLTATGPDAAEAVLERRDVPTTCRQQIADYCASHGPEVQVAIEAVGFYHWFRDTVKPKVSHLHLADPAGIAVIDVGFLVSRLATNGLHNGSGSLIPRYQHLGLTPTIKAHAKHGINSQVHRVACRITPIVWIIITKDQVVRGGTHASGAVP